MYSTLIKNSAVLLVFFVFLALKSNAQIQLSQEAQISILTCSKGDDLYNTFGHTAIRVKDPVANLDLVFNYGMFSFGGDSFKDQAEFGIKFIRGKLEYWLGVENFDNFLSHYKYDKRWVFEQVLNLNHEQKTHLIEALSINIKAENRYYRYDFFFDNCSSRVRDILEDALGPVFGKEEDTIHLATKQSFIDLIDPYIKNKPWLDFGMDIMLGLPSSRKASKYEFMFLPYHLKTQISAANKLVVSESYLASFPERDIEKNEFHWFTPFQLFSLILVLVSLLSYKNYKLQKHSFFLDYILLFISGFFGCLFVFMWFGTEHLPAHANLNMFWAFPLNIVALFFVKKEKFASYFKLCAALASFILLAWFLSPQQYHLAIIPLSLIYLVRYAKLLSYYEQKSSHVD
ncbi:MAG: DUF4105 domain-containing protein [Chitinophagales bacterium]